MLDLSRYLHLMVEQEASDLFFSVGAPVHIKVDGVARPVGGNTALRPGMVKEVAYSIMKEEQIEDFERELEMNVALSLRGVGRFRINIFKQRGEVAMAVRYIRSGVPSVEELRLPFALRDLVMMKRGLILVVGATGSGKSTALASMIDYRNQNTTGHILTVEDPIEYLHPYKRCIVNQREVGTDTLSYENALLNAMREAPDVLLIGEIRERAIMKQALAYAETGHLCLSTLHANNANQALERILTFFPLDARDQLLMDLSVNLVGIVSQRLIPSKKGKRVPAVEVLIPTPHIRNVIRKGSLHQLKDAMDESRDAGMQTFDQALYELYKTGDITLEETLANADNRDDLALKIRLDGGIMDALSEESTIGQEVGL
jgi:twitching motility protein PilU